ncbi:penicillin-binding protein [Faecalibacter rhinopitheci]|uniref:Transpeptidase family protein n=1 Tax=Faecalibacter rhinopitheci TaxID=2779678 RepID=A0A8J7FUP8_9FLAO|nr:penicillin-binding protein [Faecalibacter rhinopitheci]MBF0596696.1 transpeptidase family protein [Faecalibacter rhinopitheci]
MNNKKWIVMKGWVVAGLLALWACAILFFMFRINIIEGEQLEEFASKNNFRLATEEAERGNLYASNGALMATTVTKHNIYVDLVAIKEDLYKENIHGLADSLSRMFDKSSAHFLTKFNNERDKKNRYMMLVKGLDYEEYQRIKKFPIFNKGQNKGGFIHEVETKRELIVQDIGARTIGYDDDRGKVGLEGAYSDLLTGIEGRRWEQFMGRGKWKPFKHWEQEPQPGSSVYTTIDADLQMISYDALYQQLSKFEARHGSVIVMEVPTGKIRAIVNLTRKEDGTYIDDYNYAVGEAAEPGSTFKAVSMLVGMDDGYFNKETTVETGNGSYQLYNRRITDSHGYGTLTVDGVIKKSSNIGTSKLINKFYNSQPELFFEKLEKWHMTKPLGIDILGEGAPVMHKPNSKSWSNVTLPVMSYGYGLSITPIQLVTFYNAIANNGKMVKPLFMDKIAKKGEEDIVFEPIVLVDQLTSIENIKAMQDMLKGAVTEGTGKLIHTENYEIAGKTGTARVEYWKKDQGMQYRASFAGYFPADKPKYSCIVVVHKPNPQKGYYGGGVTAPVFKKIADWVYSKTPIPLPAEIKKSSKNLTKSFAKESVINTNKTKNIVPNVMGYSGSKAVPVLENLGLDVRYTGLGRVTNQSIPAGTKFRKGETIYLMLER